MKLKYFVYLGPGPGYGERHALLMANAREFITWGERAHSWIGTPAEFKKQFRKVK